MEVSEHCIRFLTAGIDIATKQCHSATRSEAPGFNIFRFEAKRSGIQDRHRLSKTGSDVLRLYFETTIGVGGEVLGEQGLRRSVASTEMLHAADDRGDRAA